MNLTDGPLAAIAHEMNVAHDKELAIPSHSLPSIKREKSYRMKSLPEGRSVAGSHYGTVHIGGPNFDLVYMMDQFNLCPLLSPPSLPLRDDIIYGRPPGKKVIWAIGILATCE